MHSESAWLSSGLTLHAALEFQVHIAKGDGSTLSIHKIRISAFGLD